MSKKLIITVARQYGSGGREIGERIAEILGIPLFDKQLKNRKKSDAVNCYVLGIASNGEDLLPIGKVKLIRER